MTSGEAPDSARTRSGNTVYRSEAPPHGASLYQRMAPVLLLDLGEPFEGHRILSEVAQELGLLLWRTVRDVSLWAQTPPDERGNLFAPTSAHARLTLLMATPIPFRIATAVDTLNGMLTLASRADSAVLTVCCLEVAAWASGSGLPHTALAFAQCGALCSRADAETALHTGRYALAAEQGSRAETWLRRAVFLGRRNRDGVAHALALTELGDLYAGVGPPDKAEHVYRRAYHAGRRASVDGARARALVGLFRLALRRGDREGAARFGSVAQRMHRGASIHGRAPLLELARFWTDQGDKRRALFALRALAQLLGPLPPADQLQVSAMKARVRADRADPERCERPAAKAARLLVDESIAPEIRLSAVLDLAHAAAVVRDRAAFTRAGRAAMRLTSNTERAGVAARLATLWPLPERAA